MRTGELVGLSVGDVYRRGRFINEIVLNKHATKSKRTRQIPLSSSAQKSIKEYFAIRKSKNKLEEKEPLFPSQQRPKKPMPANTAIKTFDKMAKVAKVEKVSTHSLRRTCANSLRRNGVDLKIIQEILGHSSLAITEAYFRVDPAEKKRAMEGLRF